MAGLTSTGFEVKTAVEIVNDMNEDYEAKWGSKFDVNADVIGQYSAQNASEIALTWEAIAGLYNALNPDSNSGVMQDFTSNIIGVRRLGGASASLPSVLVKGKHAATASTTNLIVSHLSEQYSPANPLTISSSDSFWWKLEVTGPTLITSLTFQSSNSVADIVVGLILTDTEEQIATKIATGFNAAQTAGGSDVFIAEAVDIGGTWFVEIRLVLENGVPEEVTETTNGSIDFIDYGTIARFTSILESPVTVPLLTELNIDLPPSDITGAFNIEAGLAGRNTETAAELRVRRNQSFSNSGGGSLDAIIGKVGDISGVTNVSGIQNVTKVVDANGLPASSFQIIVSGTATDEEIASTILASGPAGIETHGDIATIVLDSSSNPVSIEFSRTVIAYVSINVVYTLFDEGEASDLVIDEIKNALMNIAGVRSSGGVDLLPAVYEGAIMANVAGLESATVTFNVSNVIEANPVYSSGRQVINNLQIPEFDADRIQVSL